MNPAIADLRKEYSSKNLLETDIEQNPINQFDKWWHEAINSQIDEVNAMTLATSSKEGIPHARIVLLKSYDENGFVFFTNYQSHKGHEMEDNPKAALVFFWKELERQIRIEGSIEKINASESDAYFFSRPHGSRIGAWASPQSTVIPSRDILEYNVVKYQKEFGEDVPRPQHWGGYIVKPSLIEFWQGRPSRLHDRIQYTLEENGGWKIERLAP